MIERILKFSALMLLAGGLYASPAAISPAHAGAADKLQYNCPNLHTDARRTIAELTQGNDGWFFRLGDINEYFALLPHAKDYLTRLSQAFASQGTDLILLQVPPRPFSAYRYFNTTQPGQQAFNRDDAIRYYNNYIQDLTGTGASIVHLLDKMEDRDRKHDLNFFYKRDTHWTPFGAKLAAERIAKTLKNNKKYQSIKPAAYKTEITGELKMKSIIAMEVETLCEDKVPAESYPSYQTNVVLDKGTDALFGEVSSAAPLVLLGSSFSAVPWFNFDGFLSEYTGLEVANFAISAGKLFNAIVSYTALPKDERLNPDFVVWENLAHYDFNTGDTMFRQAIPAVYGECSIDQAVASTVVTVTGNEAFVPLFDLPIDKKISGTNYFLFLKSDNKGLSNFTIEMEYEDGDGEWFILDRRENFNNSGRFFVELSEEITSTLQSIKLVGLPAIKANLEVRLCHISGKK